MANKKTFLAFLIFLTAISLIIFAQNAKKLSMFGYKGETNSVKLIVDTEIARLRYSESFIPLYIHLGHSEKDVLKATRGSFALKNPDGTSVSLPSYEEVLKNYGGNLISSDYNYLKRIDDYAVYNFLSCKRISRVAFFPNPASGSILYDTVEMPNRSYFRTILYFPNNSTNKEGTYTLIFEDKEKGIKVETPFEIKWMKK
ncbi:MAG: hypothetical protein N2445_03910 [Acidobacteria bacterium]|nr:hypothetical protein [Acidobacteriota bacterium]